jgi:ferredoxin-thioredoxin reductase catalytic subunit/rubredoxin
MEIHRCSVCGYLYRAEEAPAECPFCHNKGVFDQIPENKINYDFFKDTWQRQVKWMNATKYQNEIRLNPDENVLKQLADNEGKKLLEGKQAYCPCRLLTGNEWADRKIICPCYLYMGEIELQGHCHCSLYVTDKWIEENK